MSWSILPPDKISMLPLKLMEIHGFFFLVFSLCQCLFIPTEYSLETGWSLRLWTIGNTWEGRQGMKWVDDPKRNLAGDTMRHGFVHGPCSLLQLFIKASELWSSWLVLFLSFHPTVCKWDFEIHWYSVVDGSSVKPTSPELFSLGVLRAGKHLRWKAWEGLGTAQTSVWAALPCCKGARCIPKEPGQPFEFFAVPFILALSSFAEVKTL